MSERYVMNSAHSLLHMLGIPRTGVPYVIEIEGLVEPSGRTVLRSITTQRVDAPEENYLRKITKSQRSTAYYVDVTLTCGHVKKISIYQYRKHSRGQLYCFRCRNAAEGEARA